MSFIPVRPPSYQTIEERPPAAVPIPIGVRIVKRSIDLVVSTLGLVLLVVIFPIIALAIRLDSKGPILFRQRRAGALQGRIATGRHVLSEFDMFKFRSMRTDAEKYTGAVFADEADPRVTRVGRFLRKTRLDELPQFWNVFRGEMSVVGPRPERPEILENLALAIPFFEERMRDARPGITGLAQVSLGYSGRAPEGSEIARHERALVNPYGFPEAEGALADDLRTKLLFDLAYVAALERVGTYLVMELTVLAKTPLVMLRGLGR